jgi:periplasmic copper chaperone A
MSSEMPACDPHGRGEHQSCREHEWCDPHGRGKRLYPVGALLYICAALLGCSQSEVPIKVTDAWAPATPPNASIGAAYMQIEAREADTLIALSSPVAESVELHRTSFDEGVATMRKVDSVVVSPNTPLVLTPNGMHLMLHQLVSPLQAGQHFSVMLRFQHAGEVTAQIEVKAAGEHQNHH